MIKLIRSNTTIQDVKKRWRIDHSERQPFFDLFGHLSVQIRSMLYGAARCKFMSRYESQRTVVMNRYRILERKDWPPPFSELTRRVIVEGVVDGI